MEYSQYLATESRNGRTDNGESENKVLIFVPRGKTWVLSWGTATDDDVDGDYYGQLVKLSGGLMVIGARNVPDSAENIVAPPY